MHNQRVCSRPKTKKKISGATFHIPITKSATLNRLEHCSLWQFSGGLVFLRALFCISGAKSPGAPPPTPPPPPSWIFVPGLHACVIMSCYSITQMHARLYDRVATWQEWAWGYIHPFVSKRGWFELQARRDLLEPCLIRDVSPVSKGNSMLSTLPTSLLSKQHNNIQRWLYPVRKCFGLYLIYILEILKQMFIYWKQIRKRKVHCC